MASPTSTSTPSGRIRFVITSPTGSKLGLASAATYWWLKWEARVLELSCFFYLCFSAGIIRYKFVLASHTLLSHSHSPTSLPCHHWEQVDSHPNPPCWNASSCWKEAPTPPRTERAVDAPHTERSGQDSNMADVRTQTIVFIFRYVADRPIG